MPVPPCGSAVAAAAVLGTALIITSCGGERAGAATARDLQHALQVDDQSPRPSAAAPRPTNASDLRLRPLPHEDTATALAELRASDGVLTWEDYYTLVRRHAPDLAALRARAAVAISAIDGAAGWEDPELEATTRPGTWDAERPAVRAQLKIPIPWLRRLAARSDAAAADAQAAVLAVGELERHHLVESRAAYGDYVLAYAQRRFLQDALLEADDLICARSAETAAGADAGAIARAQLVHADLRRRLLAAKRMQRSARLELAAGLGMAEADQLPPPLETLPPPLDPTRLSISMAIAETRPEVAMAEARVVAAEARLRDARANSLPEWRFRIGYEHAPVDEEERAVIGFDARLPVTSARRRSEREAALQGLAAARAELREERAEARRAVAESLARLEELHGAIVLIDETELPAARDALAYATSGLAAGTGTLAAVLQARIRIADIRIRRAREHRDYYFWLGELECCIGRILPGRPADTRPLEDQP